MVLLAGLVGVADGARPCRHRRYTDCRATSESEGRKVTLRSRCGRGRAGLASAPEERKQEALLMKCFGAGTIFCGCVGCSWRVVSRVQQSRTARHVQQLRPTF